MEKKPYYFVGKVSEKLKFDEGFSERLYKDVKGFNTIGYGFNLDVNGLPLDVGNYWLEIVINKLENDLSGRIVFWHCLNDAKKYVLINMAYQLGISGLLKFNGFLDALASNNDVKAEEEMKDSIWYRDFTSRATRLINVLRSGDF